MDEYTRGVQDGLKAAADKWAARCARAEARVAELERQHGIEGVLERLSMREDEEHRARHHARPVRAMQ